MLVLELLKAGAWQGSWGRAGRAGARQSSKTKTLFQGLGSSKCWFWNCSKPGHGRAARAEQARQGQQSSKTTKKTFFKAWEAQNAGFWNCSKLDGIYLRVMVRSAFKKCTPDSREGSTFLMQPVLLRNFPDPWNCNVVFLT